MPISDNVKTALYAMDNSSTTEGQAIADCLRDVMENDDDDDPITDEYLAGVAEELVDWAQFFIKAVRP